MNHNERIKSIVVLVLCLVSHGCFATLDTKAIERLTPDDITVASIEAGDEGVRIEGTANDLPAISRYMRVLDDKVGSPSLEKVTRKDNVSEFVIVVKKPRG